MILLYIEYFLEIMSMILDMLEYNIRHQIKRRVKRKKISFRFGIQELRDMIIMSYESERISQEQMIELSKKLSKDELRIVIFNDSLYLIKEYMEREVKKNRSNILKSGKRVRLLKRGIRLDLGRLLQIYYNIVIDGLKISSLRWIQDYIEWKFWEQVEKDKNTLLKYGFENKMGSYNNLDNNIDKVQNDEEDYEYQYSIGWVWWIDI